MVTPRKSRPESERAFRTNCENCGVELVASPRDSGKKATCPECGVELEVIALDPPEFDLAPLEDEEEDESRFDKDEEDDWDEEEHEEEDDEDEDYHRRDDY